MTFRSVRGLSWRQATAGGLPVDEDRGETLMSPAARRWPRRHGEAIWPVDGEGTPSALAGKLTPERARVPGRGRARLPYAAQRALDPGLAQGSGGSSSWPASGSRTERGTRRQSTVTVLISTGVFGVLSTTAGSVPAAARRRRAVARLVDAAEHRVLGRGLGVRVADEELRATRVRRAGLGHRQGAGRVGLRLLELSGMEYPGPPVPVPVGSPHCRTPKPGLVVSRWRVVESK